jgi:hypothetical protein
MAELFSAGVWGVPSIQYRPLTDLRDPLYAPERDLANLAGPMLHRALTLCSLETLRGGPYEMLFDRLTPGEIDAGLGRMGVAAADFALGLANQALVPPEGQTLADDAPQTLRTRDITDLAKAAGFLDLPDWAQLLLLAKLGEVCMGGLAACARDAWSQQGVDAPRISVEQLADTAAQLVEGWRRPRTFWERLRQAASAFVVVFNRT